MKRTNLSPFVSEEVYKEYLLELTPIKYKVVGNYALTYPKVVTGEKVVRKFVPIGINKLHMGEIYKVR